MCTNVAACVACEAIVYLSFSIRGGYLGLPALIFAQVYFFLLHPPLSAPLLTFTTSYTFLQYFWSGIPVKPDTLPLWVSPWAPSFSLARWTAQACTIREFDGDTDAFPIIPGLNVNTYETTLSFFGWGGKSEWYCLGNIVIWGICAKLVLLMVTYWKSNELYGIRNLQKREEEIRLV
jgi:hypothetical protein